MQDLGEDVFPEPAAVTANTDDKAPAPESKVVEKQDAPTNVPGATETATPLTDNSENERKVTTAERKPMEVPDSVHIRITPENLKDYLGPPVYYKDRLFTKPPPPGVSTGLGYLGNGSGAVMPIEATVSTI